MIVRQRVLDVVEDRWDDGTRCAELVIDPALVQVLGRPTLRRAAAGGRS